MINYKSVFLITQARIGSSRFHEKILKNIYENKSVLEVHLQRLKKSKYIDKYIVATTKEPNSHKIVKISRKYNFKAFQGDEDDVLSRFYDAIGDEKPDYIVRVTSDCPLIDPILLDQIIEKTVEIKAPYCSNTLEDNFPDGQDIEVFEYKLLEMANNEAILKSDREHVTTFIKNNNDISKVSYIDSKVKKYENVRLTVDYEKDLNSIKILCNELGINKRWQDYAKHVTENPDLYNNQFYIRNEGYLKSLNDEKRSKFI